MGLQNVLKGGLVVTVGTLLTRWLGSGGKQITVMPESASLGFSSSGIGTDVWYVRCRYRGYDNSCWRSSSRPPDSLHELFQNRTEADKITNLSNSRNGFSVPMETDGGQLAAVPVRSQTTKKWLRRREHGTPRRTRCFSSWGRRILKCPSVVVFLFSHLQLHQTYSFFPPLYETRQMKLTSAVG